MEYSLRQRSAPLPCDQLSIIPSRLIESNGSSAGSMRSFALAGLALAFLAGMAEWPPVSSAEALFTPKFC